MQSAYLVAYSAIISPNENEYHSWKISIVQHMMNPLDSMELDLQQKKVANWGREKT
jgi:hypothetical protein